MLVSVDQHKAIKVRGGFGFGLRGAPRQEIAERLEVDCVGLSLRDYPDVVPALRVVEGDAVAPGQTLFVDSRRPAIAICSPVTGRVREIRRAAKRRLDCVVIECGDDHRPLVGAPDLDGPPAVESADALRAALLQNGLWTALRTRPFDRLPPPDAVADNILVTAIDTEPLAADPCVVIADHVDAFRRGVAELQKLTRGRVYVCQGPGPQLTPDAIVFEGRHPAGLPGTHIAHLRALDDTRADALVFYLGYQDAIAIGYLVGRGELWTERVVSLAGPSVREPRLVRLAPGARLAALRQGNVEEDEAHVLSGSALSGTPREFLGRYRVQVTAVREAARAAAGPIIPTERLSRASPSCRHPVPLLRALSVGDAREAAALGALAMGEDDIALLSYACTSRTDYGPLLRNALAQYRDLADAPSTAPTGVASAMPTGSVAGAGTPYLYAEDSNLQVAALYAIALSFPLLAVVLRDGVAPPPGIAVAAVTTLAIQAVFRLARRRAVTVGALVQGAASAIALGLMLPAEAHAWEVALGAAFGVVLGEQVFGGYGYHFVSPTAAALAFLEFSFPDTAYDAVPGPPWYAIIPGAMLLIARGVVSPRALLAIALACATVLLARSGGLDGLTGVPAETYGALAFAVVFFACDPVAAPSTDAGRVVYGALAGTLLGVALDAQSNAGHGVALALPILAAQIFAPLIDQSHLRLERALGEARRG